MNELFVQSWLRMTFCWSMNELFVQSWPRMAVFFWSMDELFVQSWLRMTFFLFFGQWMNFSCNLDYAWHFFWSMNELFVQSWLRMTIFFGQWPNFSCNLDCAWHFFLFWFMNELFVQSWLRMTFFLVNEWTFRAILTAHEFCFCQWMDFSCNLDCAWPFFLFFDQWLNFSCNLAGAWLFLSINELFVQSWLRMTFFFDRWIPRNFRESRRSLCSGWCYLPLPPHYALVGAVSFCLHMRTIFPENLRDHYALVDVASFCLRIMLWLMLPPSTSICEQFSQRTSEIIMLWLILAPSASILCSGWCCLLLPPHTNNFPSESQRSLCSGWYWPLLPPYYALVDAASFCLHIRTIFSENLRDHYALVDAVSFCLHIVLWLMLSPSATTCEQFSPRISEIVVLWLMLSPSTSTLCSGWCCLLLPPYTTNFLRESQRSLCSGWCCLLLPPFYALVDAASFCLHIRIIFSENLREHYALVDAASSLCSG